MLVPHSEPCSTTSRCSRPTTRAASRRASCGADLPCKNAIQMQAAQEADCSRSNRQPSLLRAVLPGNGNSLAFQPQPCECRSTRLGLGGAGLFNAECLLCIGKG